MVHGSSMVGLSNTFRGLKMDTPKICPLLTIALATKIYGDDVVDVDLRACIGPKCAFYVKAYRLLYNPNYVDVQEGCGLLSKHTWLCIPKEKFKEWLENETLESGKGNKGKTHLERQ